MKSSKVVDAGTVQPTCVLGHGLSPKHTSLAGSVATTGSAQLAGAGKASAVRWRCPTSGNALRTATKTPASTTIVTPTTISVTLAALESVDMFRTLRARFDG